MPYAENSLSSPVGIVLILLNTALLALATIFFCNGLFLKKKFALAKNWPTADGKITSSDIICCSNTDDNGSAYTLYHAEIEFTYAAQEDRRKARSTSTFNKDGLVDYTSNKIDWGIQLNSSSIDDVKPKVDKYPVGKRISVYFNPADPQDCIVELDSKNNSQLYVFLGFFMLAVFSLFFVALLQLVFEFGISIYDIPLID